MTVAYLPWFLFFIGLAIGSFLNVLSFRYTGDNNIFLSATGRSHCPHCRKNLSWYELIPVLSYLFQLGTCRSCGKRLSLQYPIVELLSGFIFLSPFYFPAAIVPAAYFLIFSALLMLILELLLLIATVDFRLYIIPNELNAALALSGAALAAARSYYGQFGRFSGSFIGSTAALFGLRDGGVWLNHTAGLAAGLSFFLIIVILSRGRGMGMGDVKLIAALGLAFGWPDVIFIAMFSFIVGTLYFSPLIAYVSIQWILKMLKMKHREGVTLKRQVPFGPFIVAATCAVLFFGEPLVNGYFHIFL